jgi:superfamily II DNA or RNA helicase
MQIPPSTIQSGQEVIVRRQRWRITRIRPYESCTVVSMCGIGAANGGTERHFLVPFDLVEPAAQRRTVRLVGRTRWRRACRAALALTEPSPALRTAARAAIDLLPHQLEPALAVIAGKGSRVLLADDVGLGKTIQAGLIVSELRARDAADHVLILTPAGLRDQWREELARRFEMDASVLDFLEIRRRAAQVPPGVNPWTTCDIAIASVDYIKRPEVLAAALARCWDVVIVDEAHALGEATDRIHAAAALAARATCVVLVTATPHSGDRQAFLTLCETGGCGEPLLVFRRTRTDVRGDASRKVHCLNVRSTEAERRMHQLLGRFARAVGGGRSGTSHDVWLALAVLHKRALSSARSLQLSVERRLADLARAYDAHDPAGGQFTLPFDQDDGDPADAAPEWPMALALTDRDRERRLLEALAGAAAAAATRETKIAAIRRLLERVREPAIVFTEYRDTLEHLAARLARPVAIVHGGLSRRERLAALDDFRSGRRDWLLATDAAAQGLNLHERCRLVVSLELPWNPVRLEQRIGRVDRIGQRRPAHAFHLIGRETAERAVFERLQARIAAAQADIGAADPLGGSPEVALAREVIAGLSGPAPSGNRQQGAPPAREPVGRIVPNLSTEARTEVRRIGLVRLHVSSADLTALRSLSIDAPWLAWSRGGRSRRRLGRSVLLLVRCSLADGADRDLGQMLVPLAVGLTAEEPVTRATIDLVWRAVSTGAGALAREDSVGWQQDTIRVAAAFAAARLARNQAARAALVSPSDLYQAGLFDRRAAQERVTSRSMLDRAAASLAEREADARLRSRVSFREPELWLVLAR